jgi:hypothetical protein
MVTVTTFTFFSGFAVKKGDNSNVIAFLYGGGVVRKTLAAVFSFFLFFFYFFLWSFWLYLTINNGMVVFFMLKVVMARGRRLKKGGGDLEVHK